MADGTNSPVQIPADDVAGTIAARQALGQDNEQAVIQAFLERTGYAIDARVDARMEARQMVAAATQPAPRQTANDPGRVVLALGSMLFAIPLTGIATQFSGAVALFIVIVAWVGIVAVNIAYNRHR
jgi:hypothetical protein